MVTRQGDYLIQRVYLDGAPLDPSAWVLRYALGGGVEATVHATADAAKAHAEATLRMRGML